MPTTGKKKKSQQPTNENGLWENGEKYCKQQVSGQPGCGDRKGGDGVAEHKRPVR